MSKDPISINTASLQVLSKLPEDKSGSRFQNKVNILPNFNGKDLDPTFVGKSRLKVFKHPRTKPTHIFLFSTFFQYSSI